MQQVYRIIMSDYSYDSWDIFTEDKELFNSLTKFSNDEEAKEVLGEEKWDEILNIYNQVKFPYILLGETIIRQTP